LLRGRLEEWAAEIEHDMADARPSMPGGVVDRDADVWEPLLAVADTAGGSWPERARVAAVALVADSKRGTPSPGIKLLADLRLIFCAEDHLATEDILAKLHMIEESPWGDLRGKPLDARGLAQRLRPYDIKPTTVRSLLPPRRAIAGRICTMHGCGIWDHLPKKAQHPPQAKQMGQI
jgi:hypothetical protein